MQSLRDEFGDGSSRSAPSLAELRAALDRLVPHIAAHGTFNMMLSDGTALFTHCSTKLCYIVRKYPFTAACLSDEDLSVDFSQVTTPNDRVAIIVTEPLTNNETWTHFAPGELKLFVDGLPQ